MTRMLMFVPAALVLAGCGNESALPLVADGAARQEAGKLDVQPGRVDPVALKGAVKDGPARGFYEARGWQAAWDDASTAALLGALGQAERHALSRAMFLKVAASSNPLEKEVALTRAALDYASALARGRLDPTNLFEIYTVPRPNPDLAAGLAAAIGGKSVAEWFESLPPQTAEYRALSEAYLHYLKMASRQDQSEIAGGELIKPGSRDPRVPRLAEALREYGYLASTANDADPVLYTPAVADAVLRLQADYGLQTDGIVGPDTLGVLNTSAADKARQLAVNLERRRWLERDPPATRIDVNTAATTLDYWVDGQHRNRANVVTGQPGWETPQLQSPVFQLVANPTWTVPRSIQEEEIAPKGAAYMARNNMVWRDGWIVQRPGPDNALGEVKLDMRNDHAIYLHDTPAKALFAENERHRSHGCVRVENAVEFARTLAAEDGILPRFDRARATGDESFVKLGSAVPVRLLYHSAIVDDGGRVRFRTDAYGWDEQVARALGLAAREDARLRSHMGDVGP